MRALRAHQLAGCRGLQTLRDFAGPYVPTSARSYDLVQGLLRADGTLVFGLCSGGGFLNHCSANRSRHVSPRSWTAGGHPVVYGYCVGHTLRDRRVPAAEALGVGVWTRFDLYRSHKSLLSAGHGAVVDSLD